MALTTLVMHEQAEKDKNENYKKKFEEKKIKIYK